MCRSQESLGLHRARAAPGGFYKARLLEYVAQDRLGGVARSPAELLLDRTPHLVARGRGEHAPRERARDLLADLAAGRAVFAAEVVQLEIGQVHALRVLGAGRDDKDLAARKRELVDREAVRLARGLGLRFRLRPARDMAAEVLDVRAAIFTDLEAHGRIADVHARDPERL